MDFKKAHHNLIQYCGHSGERKIFLKDVLIKWVVASPSIRGFPYRPLLAININTSQSDSVLTNGPLSLQ